MRFIFQFGNIVKTQKPYDAQNPKKTHSMLCGNVWTFTLFGSQFLVGVEDNITIPHPINSLLDLVCVVGQKPLSLEPFAVVAWLVWCRRNKIRCNEPSLHQVENCSIK